MQPRTNAGRSLTVLRKVASAIELIYATHEHAAFFTDWTAVLVESERKLLGDASLAILQVLFPGGYFSGDEFEKRSDELVKACGQVEASLDSIAQFFNRSPELPLKDFFDRLRDSWEQRKKIFRDKEITREVVNECWFFDLGLIEAAHGFKFYADKMLPTSLLSGKAVTLLMELNSVKELQAEMGLLIHSSGKYALFQEACSAWYLSHQVGKLQVFLEQEKALQAVLLQYLPHLKSIHTQWLQYINAHSATNVCADMLWKQHEGWLLYLDKNPSYCEEVKSEKPGLFAQQNGLARSIALWRMGRSTEALRALLPSAVSGDVACIKQLIEWLAVSNPQVAIVLLQAEALFTPENDYPPLLDKLRDMHRKMQLKDSESILTEPENGQVCRDIEQHFSIQNIKNRVISANQKVAERLLRLAEMQLVLFRASLEKEIELAQTNPYLTTACSLMDECYTQDRAFSEKIKSFCGDLLSGKSLRLEYSVPLLSVLEHCGSDLSSYKAAPRAL